MLFPLNYPPLTIKGTNHKISCVHLVKTILKQLVPEVLALNGYVCIAAIQLKQDQSTIYLYRKTDISEIAGKIKIKYHISDQHSKLTSTVP